MDQDAAWTRLFGQPFFAEHLVRLALPGLARWLDFSMLEEVPTRWALVRPASHGVAGYAARTGDRAWRVAYGDDSGRSLLMPTEFQSDTDANMDVRGRQYGLLGYQAVTRHRPDRDGSVRVVPVVLYSGGARWAVSYPGWAQPSANVTADGEPWLEARASCVLLDADSCERDDSAQRPNLVRALLRMNAPITLEEAVELLAEMAGWLHGELVRERAAVAIHELVDWWAICSKQTVTSEQVAEVRQTLVQGGAKEMMGLARSASEWPRIWREEGLAEGRQAGRVEGRQEGRAEGRRDGQIELLRARMARKFGEEAAGALARRLRQLDDTNAFLDVDEWIMQCGTAPELHERIDRILPSAD